MIKRQQLKAQQWGRLDTALDTFLMQKLTPGYNCRAFVWLGPARTETVFDTGSTRNSVDKGYLKALLSEKKTAAVCDDLVDIEPLTCRSVDAKKNDCG